MASITILTYDTRWKGLVPSIKRAADILLSNSSCGGESKRVSVSVGGKKLKSKKTPPMKLASLRSQVPALPQGGSYSVTILLTNDAEVKSLNKKYRGKNKPTNVLSFPDGTVEDKIKQLGDVALAYETIAREAKEQDKTMKAHVTHLTIHGVLHLLGYDHENENDAKTMESLETAILSSMGIANPYETS